VAEVWAAEAAEAVDAADGSRGLCTPATVRSNRARKEVKGMCEGSKCCQKPEKLLTSPKECSPEQIRECHGDVEEHPCVSEKKPCDSVAKPIERKRQ